MEMNDAWPDIYEEGYTRFVFRSNSIAKGCGSKLAKNLAIAKQLVRLIFSLRLSN